MSVESIITGLVNAGGLGLLAAALFWLHNKSIERFDAIQQRMIERFDQITQRTLDAYAKEIAAERAVCMAHHEAVLLAFKEQRHAIKDVQQTVAVTNAMIRASLKLPEPLATPAKEEQV